jgi:hypothetical protein
MSIEVLDIDIAKNVFQFHGVNRDGGTVFKRRVMRDQLLGSGRADRAMHNCYRGMYRSVLLGS